MKFAHRAARRDTLGPATGLVNPLRKAVDCFSGGHRAAATATTYCLTDRLHQARTVRVPGPEIASTVSAWLAELGADSPLVEDFARAACVGDWAVAYAVGDQLSIDVTVAPAA